MSHNNSVAKTAPKRGRTSQRLLSSAQLADHYLTHGMTIARIQSVSSFDEVQVVLRDETVVEAARLCLQRIRHIGAGDDESSCDVKPRVFLAAYMIGYFGSKVFEQIGDMERELMEAADSMLKEVEGLCQDIKKDGRVPKDAATHFLATMDNYYAQFHMWKKLDEKKLADRIKHVLRAMYQSLRDSSDQLGSPVVVELNRSIERMRAKMVQIAGQTVLDEFDAEMQQLQQQQARADTTTTTTTVITTSAATTTVTTATAATDVDRRSIDESSAVIFGVKAGNEQLAHELLLDPNFKLDRYGGGDFAEPVMNAVRRSLQDAFWKSLVDDLRLAQPVYTRVLKIVGEIRAGIVDLRPSPVADLDALDVDYIKDQVERRLFGWDRCSELVRTMCDKLTSLSSGQRAETLRLWVKDIDQTLEQAKNDVVQQPQVLCDALQSLIENVNLMRIDAANLRLSMIVPTMVVSGITYETDKFNEKLANGSLTLARTQKWIASVSNGAQPENYVKFLNGAVLSLVVGGDDVRYCAVNFIPETLALDGYKLHCLHHEFHFLVRASVLLIGIATKLSGGRDAGIKALKGVSDFFAKAPSSLKIDDCVDDIAKELVGTNLCPTAVRNGLLNHSSNPNNQKVTKLITERMMGVWRSVMDDNVFPVDAPFFKPLHNLVPRIKKAATRLKRICDVDRDVHAAHYTRIIETLSM